jgi:hypothetical protein
MKQLIFDNQLTLFGSREVIGFGSDNFYIKEIDRKLANEIIIKNHYTKKVFQTSFIHLGIFIKNQLLGVLQYGRSMNPASCGGVVKNTKIDEHLELNRMWLDDKAQRNSESKAISYSLRYIRTKYPKIKWIQSFADERCGCFGIVYQACNFSFYGEHIGIFWEYKNVVYHNIQMTIKKGNKRYSKNVAELQKNKHKAKKMTLRQFRYIFFIDKRKKKDCLLEEKPYLKHYNND